MTKVQRFNKNQMDKVGVEIEGDLKKELYWLKCRHCGTKWKPSYRTGGLLRNGYWVCPNKCNEQ